MSEIIAEIGVNWFGDLEIAKQMIHQSSVAGADSVKFQMFNEKVIAESPHKKNLLDMILDESSLKELSAYAKKYALRFGVSVMYPEAFEILEKIKLDFIKIRHADRLDEKLAVMSTDYCKSYISSSIPNVTLLVSTSDFFVGYKLRHDISDIYFNKPQLDIFCLYCISKYPPKISDINLKIMIPEYYSGYSNHYPHKFLPMLAISQGLYFIEIHVKTNNTGIDDPVSLTFEELNQVCRFRNIRELLLVDKKEEL